MSRPAIAVVGSLNVDLTLRCDRLPHPGETVPGRDFTQRPGGKGANQALAAARLGADVRLIGRTGADSYAEVAVRNLRAAGVDLSLVTRAAAPTGLAMILVDDTGENQIVLHPGANAMLDLADIELGDGDAVICQLEVPGRAIAQAARATHGRGLFCLNAAPALPVPSEALARAVAVTGEGAQNAMPTAAQVDDWEAQ